MGWYLRLASLLNRKIFCRFYTKEIQTLSNNWPSNGNRVRRATDIPRSRQRWQAESALAEPVIVRVPLTIRSLSLSAFVLWMNVEPALGSPPVLHPAILLPTRPQWLQPSSLCHRLTLVRLASALCLRHLFLFHSSPRLSSSFLSPALRPSLSEAERVWSPLIRTLRSSEQQSRRDSRLSVSSSLFARLTPREDRSALKNVAFLCKNLL